MAKEITKLSDLVPDSKNANAGTTRGRGMVETSLLGLGNSGVAGDTKRQSVCNIVSRLRVSRPRQDVMCLNIYAALAAVLAGVIVTVEYAFTPLLVLVANHQNSTLILIASIFWVSLAALKVRGALPSSGRGPSLYTLHESLPRCATRPLLRGFDFHDARFDGRFVGAYFAAILCICRAWRHSELFTALTTSADHRRILACLRAVLSVAGFQSRRDCNEYLSTPLAIHFCLGLKTKVANLIATCKRAGFAAPMLDSALLYLKGFSANIAYPFNHSVSPRSAYRGIIIA